ncbi:hypothetical protein F5Y06DRAFT_307106 [Hypoxylon sp. FL0890]|nr:hypothetical protein F5Y06DRAFT_307106 [Hypoxylon sp. FL0890]
MVSFKKFFLLGVALFNAINAIPTPSLTDLSLADRDALLEGKSVVANFARDEVDESTELDKRAGHMTLQWSPQGCIVFLLGAIIPQGIHDGLVEQLGEGAPGKALLENFNKWLLKNALDYRAAFSVFERAAVRGGVYGKAAGDIANDFGFAVVTLAHPSRTELQALLKAISAWGSQAGGLVQVIARDNNFYDPSTIGAGKKRDVKARSRGNTCPANTDLLKYATKAVSTDIDINRDIRFAGACTPR